MPGLAPARPPGERAALAPHAQPVPRRLKTTDRSPAVRTLRLADLEFEICTLFLKTVFHRVLVYYGQGTQSEFILCQQLRSWVNSVL